MPRTKRHWVSQLCGSFHIISRLADSNARFNIEEKEYFLSLMEKLSSGFFIQIHAFCIMGNHFHILATGMELEAQNASKDDLIRKYKLIYGKNAEPPQGSYQSNGDIVPDADGGIERLRNRLGSVSRFVQELKQSFSRWYNKKHDRKGYLWGNRFKGVIIDQGEAQLICSSYIDLNPVRAGIAQRPEDYRWNSLGFRLRSPVRAGKFLYPISTVNVLEELNKEKGFVRLPKVPTVKVKMTVDLSDIEWYRQFVYLSGGIEHEGKASLAEKVIDQVLNCHGELKIKDRLGYRLKNLSEGIVIGSYSMIAKFQETENRKNICPRLFIDACWAYTTRVWRNGNLHQAKRAL
ncbi:MAG TPA: transposase [Candidatus Kapabacteria bacterium]|nr:transposase [Candidatus Kapabacteria bacterium]